MNQDIANKDGCGDFLACYENSHQGTKAPRYTKGLYYKKLVIGALSPGFSLSPGVGEALMNNYHENKLKTFIGFV